MAAGDQILRAFEGLGSSNARFAALQHQKQVQEAQFAANQEIRRREQIRIDRENAERRRNQRRAQRFALAGTVAGAVAGGVLTGGSPVGIAAGGGIGGAGGTLFGSALPERLGGFDATSAGTRTSPAQTLQMGLSTAAFAQNIQTQQAQQQRNTQRRAAEDRFIDGGLQQVNGEREALLGGVDPQPEVPEGIAGGGQVTGTILPPDQQERLDVLDSQVSLYEQGRSSPDGPLRTAAIREAVSRGRQGDTKAIPYAIHYTDAEGNARVREVSGYQRAARWATGLTARGATGVRIRGQNYNPRTQKADVQLAKGSSLKGRRLDAVRATFPNAITASGHLKEDISGTFTTSVTANGTPRVDFVPKGGAEGDTNRQDKINELMTTFNMTRPAAVDVVDNVTVTQSESGIVKITNKRTGEVITGVQGLRKVATTAPRDDPSASLKKTTQNLKPEQTLWGNRKKIAGIAPAAKRLLAGVAGQIPGVKPDTSEVRAAQIYRSASRDLARALARNPRFAEGERVAIEKAMRLEPRLLESDDTVEAQLIELDNFVDRKIADADADAQNPELSDSIRSNARRAASDLRSFSRVLGVPNQLPPPSSEGTAVAAEALPALLKKDTSGMDAVELKAHNDRIEALMAGQQ